jgi:hypothetical protein
MITLEMLEADDLAGRLDTAPVGRELHLYDEVGSRNADGVDTFLASRQQPLWS